MKVKKSTHNFIVHGELRRVPLQLHINSRMICLWQKILSGKREKISRTLYIVYNLHKEGVFHPNWLLHVKDVLDSNGFLNYWNRTISVYPKKYIKKGGSIYS
jgi:hypothetical protein